MGIFLDFMLVLGAMSWVFYLAKLIYDVSRALATAVVATTAHRTIRIACSICCACI